MSGGLSAPALPEQPAAGAATRPPASRPGALLAQVLVILAAFVVAGVLGGWVWEKVWTPPSGLAFNHRFFLDDQGLQQDFSGTGTFVLVSGALGLPLGALAVAVFRTRALVTLVAVTASAAVAAWVMWRTGHALGPGDPAAAARSLPDFEPVRGDLRVVGWSPYLVLPMTALAGLTATLLTWPTSPPVLARDEPDVGRLPD